MLNYWWVTRPKRKLNTIPEVLALVADAALNEQWEGNRDTHLTLEEMLEQSGLKRTGERRDHTAGGGRTYAAWVASLGLTFIQKSTNQLKLTLAGEALLAGDSPVGVLKNQVLKYQFPSSYSLNRGVNVSKRFKIRPFRFLLKLLNDSDVAYLTEEEIAKIIITEAENETEECYKYVVKKLIAFRDSGDTCLSPDFHTLYASGRGTINIEKPYRHLTDIANTLINWIEFTQLAVRDDGKLQIIDEKIQEVQSILSATPPFIDRPQSQEFFQRKYGVDPKHTKDTRNLTATKTITAQVIIEHQIKKAFIGESLKSPISRITAALVNKIAQQTGFIEKQVEETLQKLYPNGAIGAFMTEYYHMAFKGRDEAVDFERATVELFENVFGITAKHVGSTKLNPDVFLLSDDAEFIGIIDNKAYSKYTISNDHRNRMVHNYIKSYTAGQSYPLAFFSYISGGFGKNIDSQIKSIADETSVNGSAINVSNMINLVETYKEKGYHHSDIKDIFSLNRQVMMRDL